MVQLQLRENIFIREIPVLGFNNIDNFNISSITTRQITGNLNGNITSNGPVTVTVCVSGKSRSYSNLLTIANPRDYIRFTRLCFLW